MFCSQLTQLILDFYREDPNELQQLKLLHQCKVFRRWGVFQVNCQNLETAAAIVDAYTVLREPIVQLKLAQKIKVLVNGTLFLALPIDLDKLSVQSAQPFRI